MERGIKITCDGAFSPTVPHPRVEFEIDQYEVQVHSYNLDNQAWTWCPICEIKGDIQQTKAEFEQREQGIAGAFATMTELADHGRKGLDTLKQEVVIAAGVGMRLSKMLAWWEETVAIQTQLEKDSGPTIEEAV